VVSAWADLRERIGQPMCEGIRVRAHGMVRMPGPRATDGVQYGHWGLVLFFCFVLLRLVSVVHSCCQARGLRGGLVHVFGPPIESR
jgi:hypothetical protein